ncbi:hypothetical protein KRP22_010279 [Phytophthora ramorum]|uniref:Uncharacterized protein n=1 Tax=Phytophthora ramorum TaxID=164328 RepID=H3GXH5_PHYRM|nr:hypothetical protein KRP22_5852 [Phytophthora ramorum]
MESLYARDTPTAQERKLKLAERQASPGDLLKQDERSQQSTGTLESLMETPSESTTNGPADDGTSATTDSTANPTDDAFGFNFSSLPREELDEQWRSSQPAALQDGKSQLETLSDTKKTEEERLAEPSSEPSPLQSVTTHKVEAKTMESAQETPQEAPATAKQQPRRAGVASGSRKPKPAITINTGFGSTGVGAKRPPPTPVSPPTFSWNDILRVQNLIERCLQQYLSKNDILIMLKEQANVDPAFANVVWQKLEEQNPTFFRAYGLQLQLKEQIIAFNYLVGQQKEMAAKGGKRLLHYSNINRTTGSRTSAPCSLATAPTTTTLPPISMDARTFLRTPIRSAKQQRTPAGKRAYNQHMNMYQLGSPSVSMGANSTGMSTLPPPSPLPLPSPIKTDLDTHAFFT